MADQDSRQAPLDSERLFRMLFESSPDAIFIEDLDGRVLDCNPAAATLHGMDREKIIGKHVSQLVPADRREGLVGISDDTPVEFEGYSLRSDGLAIPVSIRTSLIEYFGKPGLLLHVRDITDRKRQEVEMRRINESLGSQLKSRTTELTQANEALRRETAERQKLERERDRFEERIDAMQKMEAVGRIAGGVSHDFNNLLTIIIGRCDVLIGRLEAEHPLQTDISMIHDAARKAALVTKQLLSVSRKQSFAPGVLSLNSLIRDIEPMLRSMAGENIRFEVDLGSGKFNVAADTGQLEQVIINLVLNALDAMPDGGQLELKTHDEEVTPDSGLSAKLASGHYVTLSVTDSGHGMNSETLSHIFEPFFTTKEKSDGTGLGLATVDRIVSQSGGHIRVESKPGKGTTFRIYLPGVRTKAAPAEKRATTPRGTETILVVEDAAIVRTLAREILEGHGYKVLDAPNGEKALHVCKTYRDPIHLTLTDIVMPQMNGRELSKRVVRMRPGMKVLLMSGDINQIEKGDANTFPENFVAKPFTAHSLASKVREVLDTPV